MFGAILKAANSSFQKGITFCRSVYVKKVMKLLAFIFEQPSYILNRFTNPIMFGIILKSYPSFMLRHNFYEDIMIQTQKILL